MAASSNVEVFGDMQEEVDAAVAAAMATSGDNMAADPSSHRAFVEEPAAVATEGPIRPSKDLIAEIAALQARRAALAKGKRTVVAERSGCLGGCTILLYCSRTFWVYIAPFVFLSKHVVCSLILLIAIFFKLGEGTCASNPSKCSQESVKKKCCVECWLFLLWWAWQP